MASAAIAFIGLISGIVITVAAVCIAIVVFERFMDRID